ncbi:hypothetical protein Tco_1416741, partial [Tanacetum coccineum]
DPYEAIRQAYLVETDTESEPFEDPVKTKTPESPHTVASPTSQPDSTPSTHYAEELEDSDTSGARSTPSDFTALLSPNHPLTYTTPTLVPFLHRTARMAVHVPPAMSPSLSANIANMAAMSYLAFRKRFRSSYETLPSSSPPELPSRKHYQGTSELVEDDEEEEDEEVEASLDSNSESEDAEDEGPAVGDKGLAAGDEGPGMRDESLGLGGDKVVPKGQQRTAPIMETAVEPERPERVSALRQPTLTTWIDLEDGRVYIDVPAYPPPAPPVQTRHLLSGRLVEMQGGLIHDHTIQLVELSPALFERYDRDIGELFTRSGVVRNEIFSQRYRLRILEHEQERVVVTFGAIWRPVLALES